MTKETLLKFKKIYEEKGKGFEHKLAKVNHSLKLLEPKKDVLKEIEKNKKNKN